MKLLDAYQGYKLKYKDDIVLICSGSFVVTFNEDAALMNYLFDYQVIHNKASFPQSALDKVKSMLLYHHVSYVVISDGKSDKKKSFPNYYEKYTKEVKNIFDLRKKIDMIGSIIEAKISEKSSNYYKILEFLDEL